MELTQIWGNKIHPVFNSIFKRLNRLKRDKTPSQYLCCIIDPNNPQNYPLLAFVYYNLYLSGVFDFLGNMTKDKLFQFIQEQKRELLHLEWTSTQSFMNSIIEDQRIQMEALQSANDYDFLERKEMVEYLTDAKKRINMFQDRILVLNNEIKRENLYVL